ncbi:hypothetical protein [Azospirillum picis]|uniref:Uncharacterized protein n=1 Tax=Azospirillum picis TaxID=488438 RepID=A0ABU0MFY6_9PROT|nr:hypothetical protein [Azospirillum picis]MBP2298614.1 hypothetical protein [Azospirillum picis]MDQ0532337.1 hypothetical protein [Azospirillum picis]
MPAQKVADEVRKASRIHARLLDAFIDLTEQELAALTPGFAAESLLESLERMRDARKSYGSTAGVMVISNMSLSPASNAA